jgi:hypothetical protein
VVAAQLSQRLCATQSHDRAERVVVRHRAQWGHRFGGVELSQDEQDLRAMQRIADVRQSTEDGEGLSDVAGLDLGE